MSLQPRAVSALQAIGAPAGVAFTDYQLEFLRAAASQVVDVRRRACLYYKTGAGKTITALAGMSLWGHTEAVVVAPPSTHSAWEEWGAKFGIEVEAMSHAKFRMKNTKLVRTKAVIADEMHMFGGHKGQGWKKLERLARGLQAPLIMASATPNYNDADRVYCIQRILDPGSCHGGYLQFVYANCTTEQNPFGVEPKVTGFQKYSGDDAAAQYLADLPGVFYLPDDLSYTIHDVGYHTSLPQSLDFYGYNERDHRMIASLMEERHTRTYQRLVDEQGMIYTHVFWELRRLIERANTPVLVYCDHATIAEALGESLAAAKVSHALVTGRTTKTSKDHAIDRFKAGDYEVLVGTASLATGTDGLDKMCDWLVILDDTDDASLRRQLIGRIMPRGIEGGDASTKHVYRLVHDYRLVHNHRLVHDM